MSRPPRATFSAIEKKLLKGLVSRFKYITESRQQDGETLNLKQDAWNQITEEFNASPGTMARDKDKLRKCWDNMKYQHRKKARLRALREEQESQLLIGQQPETSNATKPTMVKIESVDSDYEMDSDDGEITPNVEHFDATQGGGVQEETIQRALPVQLNTGKNVNM